MRYILAILLSAVALFGQGKVKYNSILVSSNDLTLSEQAIIITDYNGIDRMSLGVNDMTNEPVFRMQGIIDDTHFFLRTDLSDEMFRLVLNADDMITMGARDLTNNFGVVKVKSTEDPDAMTTIEGPSMTSRTIVLRNLGGNTAAVHLEETGGGTDTVRLSGPASTTGVDFFLPGTDGSAGQCLSTNGSGVLSWAGCAGGTGSSAGATGDVQFSADGAGTFGADATLNWNNTDKRLKIGTSPPTTSRLNVDTSIALNNNGFLGAEDAGGTVRSILNSVSGNVTVGNVAAPSSGGDLYLAAFASTTEAYIRLQARNDNVAVFQPQLTGDGASTSAYYLGDNTRPFTAYIGLGANLIGFGGSPAQLLIEEQATTAGTGQLVTILGPDATGAGAADSYVVGLPADEPAIGDALIVKSLDGSVYNLEWTPGAGGTGCTPTGAEGYILWYTGSGDCNSDDELNWDNANKQLNVGPYVPGAGFKATISESAGNTLRFTLRAQDTTSQITHRFERSDSSGWYIYRPASSSNFNFFYTGLGGDALQLEADGDIVLPTNNTGIWFDDSGSTAIRQLWMDGSNNFNVGASNQTVSSGGDLVLWATGTVGSGQIATILNWTGSQTGSFTPVSGDTIALGTASLPWATAAITQQLVIDTDFIPAHLSMEDENASGRYFVMYGPPGTMAASYSVRMPASVPSIGNVLSVASLSGGAYNLQWGAGGGGSCPGGSSGQIQFNSSGSCAGDTSLIWDNTNKRMGLGVASPAERLELSGNILFANFNSIRWRDSGGTSRVVLQSTSGNVTVGHIVEPSSGGNTIVSSRDNSTTAEMVLEARAGGIQVWRRNSGSASRAFLGDDTFPFEAYIGIGANLLTVGGAPAQLLMEDANSSGNFITILGAPGTMTSYAVRWPATPPTAGQFLRALSFSGGAWNLDWE